MPSHLVKFCQDYLTLGVDVARWRKWFLIAALALRVLYGVAELAKRFATTSDDQGLRGRTTSASPWRQTGRIQGSTRLPGSFSSPCTNSAPVTLPLASAVKRICASVAFQKNASGASG